MKYIRTKMVEDYMNIELIKKELSKRGIVINSTDLLIELYEQYSDEWWCAGWIAEAVVDFDHFANFVREHLKKNDKGELELL